MPGPARLELVVPELGLGETPVVLSRWHVVPGSIVIEGDQMVEIHGGSVAIDLPAPTSGMLVRRLVEEGKLVLPGQPLGVIVCDDDED